MTKSIILIVTVLVYCINISHAQTIDISTQKNFEVINRKISTYDSAGKKIVFLNAADGDGIAWIRNMQFSTGTIEFDVKGKNVLQQSFVGVAFHGINDSAFDAVYFRPFNFQSTDAVRKSHSVQYICTPKYDWSYLRETYPGKYENTLTQSIEPANWFHAKIVVTKDNIKVYINGDDNPSLVVQPLAGYLTGKIGFWVGNNSDGNFSNLTIQRDK